MTAQQKTMYAMRCDFTGCSSELEGDDGGAWLYDTADEARTAARDIYDWVSDGNGRDYCDRHRDTVEAATVAPTLRRESDIPLWEEP